MTGQFRGPYAFGNQVGEPWRGPYTHAEDGTQTNQVHANSPVLGSGAPAGRVVTFTATDGEAPFAVDYKDGFREGVSQRMFDHTFLSAGTFNVQLTDARGRVSNKSVTVS